MGQRDQGAARPIDGEEANWRRFGVVASGAQRSARRASFVGGISGGLECDDWRCEEVEVGCLGGA